MYEIITLDEAKRFLKITSDDYDLILPDLIKAATNLIEQYIGRFVMTRQITEYFDGQKKNHIMTNQYPIYKVTSLHDDTEHTFGTDSIVTTTDYRIYYDVGKIQLTGNEVSFVKGQQNVKLVYWAGFSRFNVIDEANNYIDIKENGGTEVNIEISSATIPDDTYFHGYNAEDLAETIQTALNADATLTNTYTVSYNHETQKFEIGRSTSTDFQILWASGASTSKSMRNLLGFDNLDLAIESSHESVNSVNGIIEDIKFACNKLISYWLTETGEGQTRVNVLRTTMPQGQGTIEYLKDIPNDVKTVLNMYRNYYV